MNSQAVPPRRKRGDGAGKRHDFFGPNAASVRGFAEAHRMSPKLVYGLIYRRLLPFRKLGSRIIIVPSEVERVFAALPGCSADEVIERLRATTPKVIERLRATTPDRKLA
jgi:hypothetical protein